jgi:hypothetical protein
MTKEVDLRVPLLDQRRWTWRAAIPDPAWLAGPKPRPVRALAVDVEPVVVCAPAVRRADCQPTRLTGTGVITASTQVSLWPTTSR